MIIRFLLFILLFSYIVWFITNKITQINLSFLKVFLFSLIGLTLTGTFLWFLSYLIEGH